MTKTNWTQAFKPLLKKYKGKKHPLDYGNLYELLVMVILSSMDSDRHINQLAPKLFESFPDMKSLSRAKEEDVLLLIKGVMNYRKKAKWLMELAQTVKEDKNIPRSMSELTKLPGIGRKSANVIMREAGVKPEGIIVDLHVVRVAPRLGIVTETNPEKIEKQLMEIIPQKDWDETGMAISFLGREICRPKNPKCPECIMNAYCAYYADRK